MKLPWTDEEIARHYRNAADQKAIIGILADLNATTRREIFAALGRQGIIVIQPPRVMHHRAKMDQEKAKRLYEMGLNDRQISKEMGIAYNTVYTWRTRNRLPANADRGNPLVYTQKGEAG